MFYDEVVTSVSLSFASVFDAAKVYRELEGLFKKKDFEHEYMNISINLRGDGVSHICASQDDFCSNIHFVFDDFCDPPNGPTHSELIDLLSELNIKNANIAIESKKELKIEDFLKKKEV